MEIALVRRVPSFVGARLILIAYARQQVNLIDPRKPLYNILNGIGSAILAYIAFHPFQVGLVLLEVTGTAISVYALVRVPSQGEKNC